MDLSLSVVFVALCLVGGPVLALFGDSQAVERGLAVGLLGLAVLLGGFGGVAALLIMRRAAAGDYHMPAGQRYPLPRGMRPRPLVALSSIGWRSCHRRGQVEHRQFLVAVA